jgi:hypothetical protein
MVLDIAIKRKSKYSLRAVALLFLYSTEIKPHQKGVVSLRYNTTRILSTLIHFLSYLRVLQCVYYQW